MSDQVPEKIDSNEAKEEKKEEVEEKKEEVEEKKEEKKEQVEEKKENEEEEKKENEEEEKSESSKEIDSESEGSKESKESKEKKEKDSEENEEDDEDDDDDIDIDDDEGNSDDYSEKEKKQKDPYHGYLNSKTEYKNFFYDIIVGDYLYGFKQNKFYKVVDYKNLCNDKKAQIFKFQLKEIKSDTNNQNQKTKVKLNKNIQYMASIYGKAIEKEKKEKDIKDNDNKIESKNNSEKFKEKKEKHIEKENKENHEQKEENKTEEQKSTEKETKQEEQTLKKSKEKSKSKKPEKDEKENPNKKKSKKKKKNYDINVVIKDLSEYTFFQKIRVIFLNSLNNPVVFFQKINMNTSIKTIIEHLASLYNFKYDRYSDKMPLHIFINGKKHSVSNNSTNKFFIPTKFDYKNDYILILEKQILKLKEYDLGRRCNYINFRGIEVPHVIYNSLYNFEIDSFIIIKDLEELNCQVYELKKNIDLRQFTDNQYTIKRKLREFLDLNWKERTNFVTTFKSNKAQKCKDNYNGNLFEINRKFILLQGKMYIFLIKSNNKKVDAFIGRDITVDGIFIVSKGDKAIINGFRGKPISDFTAYS